MIRVACRNCPAEYALTADRRLARRAGPDAVWIIVDVAAPDPAAARSDGKCSPRVRGLIKGLQKRAELSDSAYRALLEHVAGVQSSTQLDPAGADLVVRELEGIIARSDRAIAS